MIMFIKMGRLAPAVFLSCIENMEIFDYPLWEWIMTSLSQDITPEADKDLVKTILADHVPVPDDPKSTLEVLQQFKRDNSPQVMDDVIERFGQSDSRDSSDNSDTSDISL